MSNRQAEIAAALDVVPPFADTAALVAQIEKRKAFIKQCLRNSGLKVLVLGISGGVDSTTAGRLAQLAVEELRAETGDAAYRFIAVRLPYIPRPGNRTSARPPAAPRSPALQMWKRPDAACRRH